MQTTMITDENFRLKGFNIIVSEVEFLILSIALSRMADGKYVNDKDRAIAERMHNDLYEVGAGIAGIPQTDLVEDSDDLVKDLVKDTPQIDYKDGKEYLRGYKQGIEDEINKHHVGR